MISARVSPISTNCHISRNPPKCGALRDFRRIDPSPCHSLAPTAAHFDTLTSLCRFALPIAQDKYDQKQNELNVNPSAQPELAVRLAGLWIYPVKSCAGVPVENADLNERGGFKGDREWAVINAGGELVWQGGIPKMALVRPVPQSDGLLLHAPGVPPLKVNSSDMAKPCEVRIWSERLRAFETFAGHCSGPEAETWFSDLLGQPLRLVRLGELARERRTLNPLHLLTSFSLDRLNRRLNEQGHASAPVECFRPNLLIDSPKGELEPFAEENFASVFWSLANTATILQMEDPCARCIMTNIDLNDASIGKEPLATIGAMSLERLRVKSVHFGVYCRGINGGTLTRGEHGRAKVA
jgi:uncharacterized protein